jgi:hypothetical protein
MSERRAGSMMAEPISHLVASMPRARFVGLMALFLGPAIAIYTLFSIYPLIATLGLSTYTSDSAGGYHFVGLANFVMLLRDSFWSKPFWNAAKNNLLGATMVYVTHAMNFFPAEVESIQDGADRWRLGRPIRSRRRSAHARRSRTIGARPEHLTLSAEGDFATAGVVGTRRAAGRSLIRPCSARRRQDDSRRSPWPADTPPGERVQLSAPVTVIHVFDADGRRVAAGS